LSYLTITNQGLINGSIKKTRLHQQSLEIISNKHRDLTTIKHGDFKGMSTIKTGCLPSRIWGSTSQETIVGESGES
jgi:hypothetical protein